MRCHHDGCRNTLLDMSSTTATSALRTYAYGVDASRGAAVVAGTFTRMTWHVNAGVEGAATATRLAAATKQIQFSVPRSSPPA
jgi:hypothetical protein